MARIFPFNLTVRASVYGFVLMIVALTGTQGHAETHLLRIGLQTKQAEVRLQATVPVRLEDAGTELLAIPAEQVMVVKAQDNGVLLQDTAGNTLLTRPGTVQIVPAPTPDATTTALIRLLGPTRHYDGKPDRPYRGTFEILPRDGGLTVINTVDIEQYLLGVVSSEMRPSYPGEALKAQAIAARTYALKNRGRRAAQGFDLDDTPACQVYGGYFSEDPRTTTAVQETAGMVMLSDGALIDAVYSSTCGGYTESAEAAWGRKVPYLVSVPDFHDAEAPFTPRPSSEADWNAFYKTSRGLNCLQPKYANPEAFRWVRLVTRKDLEAQLPAEYRVGTIKEIVPVRRGESGRITALRLEGSERSVTIEQELPIRKALGNVRSSGFIVETYRDDDGTPIVFALWGGGWGHGLGMCQVGAVGMAESGASYESILKTYYRGISIEQR